jgi:hypothetical protein
MTRVGDLVREYYLIWKLGHTHMMPPEDWKKGTKGHVLLIQGWTADITYLIDVGNFINSKGYKVHWVDELGTNTMPVEEGAKLVEKYLVKNQLNNVTVIAHSKGGLVAKYVMDFSKHGQRLDKVYAIATGFGGTLWSKIIKHDNCEEMAADSAMIKKLQAETKNNKKIISIFPKVDNHIIPGSSSMLTGAKNIQIDIVGHTRILESPELLKILGLYI